MMDGLAVWAGPSYTAVVLAVGGGTAGGWREGEPGRCGPLEPLGGPLLGGRPVLLLLLLFAVVVVALAVVFAGGAEGVTSTREER